MTTKKKPSPTTIELVSVNALSDETGIDRRTIKHRLKKAGLVVVKKEGRAELYEKGPAIEAIQPKVEEASPLKTKIEFEKWRKLKIENDTKDGLLIPRAEVRERIAATNAKVHALLTQVENDAPSLFAGKDNFEVMESAGKAMDDVRLAWHSFAELWQ